MSRFAGILARRRVCCSFRLSMTTQVVREAGMTASGAVPAAVVGQEDRSTFRAASLSESGRYRLRS
jgi:hypothetical protein